MRQVNVVTFTMVTLAVGSAAGCATSSGSGASATVTSEDLARLQPAQQMEGIDQARQAVSQSNDEHARAQLRLREAEHESQLAAADTKSAEAATEQATTRAQIASETHDQARTQQASELMTQAAAQQRAADARTDFAKKLVDSRHAAIQATEKQTALAQAKLEVAKLQALRRSGVPTSGKYDEAAFEQRTRQAQAEFDAAQRRAKDKD